MNRRHSIKRKAELIALKRATMPSRHAFTLAAAWRERVKYADQIGTMLKLHFGTKQDAHGNSMKRLKRFKLHEAPTAYLNAKILVRPYKRGTGDQLDMELSSLKC